MATLHANPDRGFPRSPLEFKLENSKKSKKLEAVAGLAASQLWIKPFFRVFGANFPALLGPIGSGFGGWIFFFPHDRSVTLSHCHTYVTRSLNCGPLVTCSLDRGKILFGKDLFSIGFVSLSCISHVSYSIPTSCENEYYVHHRPGFALHQGSGELHEEAVGCSLDTYYDVVISGMHSSAIEKPLNPFVVPRYPEALADKTFDNTGCGWLSQFCVNEQCAAWELIEM